MHLLSCEDIPSESYLYYICQHEFDLITMLTDIPSINRQKNRNKKRSQRISFNSL